MENDELKKTKNTPQIRTIFIIIPFFIVIITIALSMISVLKHLKFVHNQNNLECANFSLIDLKNARETTGRTSSRAFSIVNARNTSSNEVKSFTTEAQIDPNFKTNLTTNDIKICYFPAKNNSSDTLKTLSYQDSVVYTEFFPQSKKITVILGVLVLVLLFALYIVLKNKFRIKR